MDGAAFGAPMGAAFVAHQFANPALNRPQTRGAQMCAAGEQSAVLSVTSIEKSTRKRHGYPTRLHTARTACAPSSGRR
jgi:hypothetical protein